MESMQIFSGSSGVSLAKKIAKLMGSKLGQIEISRFANEETRVWVSEPRVEKAVAVVEPLSTPTNEHLVEFCLICDGLRRKGATEIIAIIPWMAYSKQDKVFRSGEPLSAKVAAQILQVGRPSRIITFDLHNRATLGFFDIPIIELSAKPLLIEYFRKSVTKKTIVVAPDAGSMKASTSFAAAIGAPVVYVDKKRDLVSGKVTIVRMSKSVKGAEAIICDDNVFTGATLLTTAKELKVAGVKSIRVGLTHHLYVKGVQKKLEESAIDEIVVTDTIEQSSEEMKKSKSVKLKILSVAQLIVDELQ